MKNIIFLMVIGLILLTPSCSMFSDSKAVEKQKMYLTDIMACDSKANAFGILNPDKVEDFFDGETGSVVVVYAYIDEYQFVREFEIFRGNDGDGGIFYLTEFDRVTYPYTKCRKLKKEPKYF